MNIKFERKLYILSLQNRHTFLTYHIQKTLKCIFRQQFYFLKTNIKKSDSFTLALWDFTYNIIAEEGIKIVVGADSAFSSRKVL